MLISSRWFEFKSIKGSVHTKREKKHIKKKQNKKKRETKEIKLELLIFFTFNHCFHISYCGKRGGDFVALNEEFVTMT